jgi:hypothetical protein
MMGLLRETEVDPVFVTASCMDGIPGHRFPLLGGGTALRADRRLSIFQCDIYINHLIYSMVELKWN